MSSERKRQAARENGLKSAGRKTPQGLAASAQNARTHSLTAQTIVLDNESEPRFRQLRESYLQTLAPRNPVELDLVEEIVINLWRTRRYEVTEQSLLDHEVARITPQLERDVTAIHEPDRTAAAVQSLTDRSNPLHLLNRYQGRIFRQYERALRLFLELRAQPPLPPATSAEKQTDKT